MVIDIHGVKSTPLLSHFDIIRNSNNSEFNIQVAFEGIQMVHVKTTNVLRQVLHEYNVTKQYDVIPVKVKE